MRKGIAFILAVLLLLTLASCGSKAEETTPVVEVPETAPATTAPADPVTEPTAPAPTEPEWESGIVRAGIGEGVYAIFDAGTELNVIGQFQSYYVIEREDVNLLVHQQLLRLEEEAPFESWEGFSGRGVDVYDNVYFRGEPIAKLKMNVPVTVMESKGNWAYIVWADGKGFVRADMLSKGVITGSSADSGSSDADGTDVPVGSLTAADESFLPEIYLLGAYYGPEADKRFDPVKATVLADGTEGYICLLVRGDEVKVTSFDEEIATIWLGEEFYADIPRWLLLLPGDAPYTPWTGYVRYKGIIYGEYQMRTEQESPSLNKEVTVVDEVNGLYVVEYDGKTGYMEIDAVSDKKLTTGSGSTDSGSTWTPPKL